MCDKAMTKGYKMKSKKTWKDYFLSSGLPLEQSVIKTLEILGMEGLTEFKYERNNEVGIPTVFSVDVHGSQTYHDVLKQQLWLDIMCECKYRHDNVRWIFTPHNFGRWPLASANRILINLDQMTGPKVINTSQYLQLAEKFKLCKKGIEIYENDINNKTIEQSLNQLRYGVINKVLDSLLHQVDKLLGPISPIFVILPIIVTTAELWRINDDVTTKDIREAEEIDKVGEKLNSLIIYEPPDNLYTRYSKELFDRELTERQKQKIDKRLVKIENHGYELFKNVISSQEPSFFFVINYDHFPEIMRELLVFFGDTKLMKKRE
jgi:hypothetical protein